MRFNFVPLGELNIVEKDAIVDVIGVLRTVGEANEITSKSTHKPYTKRDLTLVDSSGFDVRLTIWGAVAQKFDVPLESVVAFKGVKVGDFGGVSLSMLMSSSMTIEPDIDEAHKLKGWFDAQGRNETFQTHQNIAGMGAAGGRPTPFKNLDQVITERLGLSEKPDFYATKATIVFIKHDGISYPACQSQDCNKKVSQEEEGSWRCERCAKSFDKPQYRYIESLVL